MSTVEDDEQDLTRKQRREQAREQRKALEEAEAAGAQRRKRLIQLGSVAAGVIVIIVVIIVATSGGGAKTEVEKTPSSGTGGTPKVVKEVTALIGGIPQNGNTLGSPKAPVTMQYFGDLECPVCRDFTEGALKPLIEKYVRTGKLKIEYRNLETATREPETFRTQQAAALAAGKQQKGWDYIELFYHQQGQEDTEYVTEKYLQELAKQVPAMNLATWTADRSSGEFTNTITSDAQAANNEGFTGTPSFLIGKTGEQTQKLEYASLKDPASFESAINGLLK
ncbi:MAG TPA: thioredoxin domain-containing protein [Solirubrobacteraceae bacterium]|jgi:protein-disulfide isomerase|nr:thioredoxin domain-containing protein [Solirubrobacteraceae bacterium]